MNESRTKLTLYGVFSKSCIISPVKLMLVENKHKIQIRKLSLETFLQNRSFSSDAVKKYQFKGR